MADVQKGKTVSLEEFMISTLAMIDALTKLLIEKGLITQSSSRRSYSRSVRCISVFWNPTAQ